MDSFKDLPYRDFASFSENKRDKKEVDGARKTPALFLPLILFIITVITTVLAGAIQQGINPLNEPSKIVKGLPFAVSLLTILMTHEMGHFLASRYHGVSATLPYFIPAPTFLGTFGAFIKMKSPIIEKKALVDIGASGPLAGFVMSILFTFIGLKLSQVIPSGVNEGWGLGTSLIFNLLAFITVGSLPDGFDILLHPVAFAGWIGFFVTALNLLPVGQLDGGHIAYALFGRSQRKVSIFIVFLLLLFGLFGWPGWLVWAVIVNILGIDHPPVMDQLSSLDGRRKLIGCITLLVFVLTFMPVPFMF